MYHDSFRTASVSSVNYGEVGRISRENMFNITAEHPSLLCYFKKNMLNYKDTNRLFLMSCIKNKIPYLAQACESTISELAFSMKMQWLE